MINVTKSFMPPIEEYEAYIKQIWESGWLTNQGPCVRELEEKLKEYLNVPYFHYVNNGTIALQLAIHALDINEGEIITTPFSFENTPRITAANHGLDKLKENVDTLLTIPNDKLIGLSEKPLLLEDAFMIADSVLKYTIEGITNIIYNKGMVNLDFNDLRTTLAGKGIGHLGIGIVESGNSILEAVKLAINSPLLDTSIQGASNLLINTCGKVNIVDLNEAISHVRELAGDHVNIIWGTVSSKDFNEDKIVVTLIATGMDTAISSRKTPQSGSPSLSAKAPDLELGELKSKHRNSSNTYPPKGIVIPSFLLEAQKKRL